MPEGSYEDFRDALRAFESGWDRTRYNDGIIADWQLDQWAGGSVQEFYPQCTSWSQLSDAEWDIMSYRSENILGFVGYQFGEALLIDLGYYDDEFFYGNGAASNTWDGTWTGKNGATSLEIFKTEAVQEKAILDAFGHNLQIIENGLASNGQSLADFFGTVRTYDEGGVTFSVELTLTGILAAAHLRGAYGTLNLLQSGSVSADEFGTSILQYVEQFGGYNSPTADQIIAVWENGKTGDEGLGGPFDNNDNGNGDHGPIVHDNNTGDADVTAETADVVINWSWGLAEVVSDFDPASSTIFVAWVGADSLEISEINGDTVFAIPSNNQTTTLEGVSFAELSPANFTILDGTAADEIFTLIGDSSQPVSPPPPPPPNDESGEQIDAAQIVALTWNWANQAVIDDFDTNEDVIDIGNLSSGQFKITEDEDGDVIIEILNNGGQIYRFDDVTSQELSIDNFTAASWNMPAIDAALDDLTALV